MSAPGEAGNQAGEMGIGHCPKAILESLRGGWSLGASSGPTPLSLCPASASIATMHFMRCPSGELGIKPLSSSGAWFSRSGVCMRKGRVLIEFMTAPGSILCALSA